MGVGRSGDGGRGRRQPGRLPGRPLHRHAHARPQGRAGAQPEEPRPGDGVLRALGLLGHRRGTVDPLGAHAGADDRGPRGWTTASTSLRTPWCGGLGADADPARLLRRGLLDAAPWLRTAAAVAAVVGFVVGSAIGLYRFRQGDAPTDRRRRAPRRRLPPPLRPRTRRTATPARPTPDPASGAGPRRRPPAPSTRSCTDRSASARRNRVSSRASPVLGEHRTVRQFRPAPGRCGARENDPGRDGCELGPAQRGIGQVASEDAVEQPPVAAVVVAGDDTVRADNVRRHRVQQLRGAVCPALTLRGVVHLGERHARSEVHALAVGVRVALDGTDATVPVHAHAVADEAGGGIAQRVVHPVDDGRRQPDVPPAGQQDRGRSVRRSVLEVVAAPPPDAAAGIRGPPVAQLEDDGAQRRSCRAAGQVPAAARPARTRRRRRSSRWSTGRGCATGRCGRPRRSRRPASDEGRAAGRRRDSPAGAPATSSATARAAPAPFAATEPARSGSAGSRRRGGAGAGR